jgi:hypothetical protein
VKIERDIYQNPSFAIEESNQYRQEDNLNANEQLGALTQTHQDANTYAQLAWYEVVWYHIKEFFLTIKAFFDRLLPQYLPRK